MKRNRKNVGPTQSNTVEVAGIKKSFLQRQAENAKPFWQALKDDLCASKGMVLSIIVALIVSIIVLGPLSCTYSSDNYTYINDTLFVGGYPMTDELGEELLDVEGNPVLAPPAITEGEGIDLSALQGRLSTYQTNYNGQTTTLKSVVKTGHIGFFNAKVTTVLDSNFATLSSTPNYQSLQHYQTVYWIVFFCSTIFGGLILWFLTECIWYGILALSRAISKKKPQEAFEPPVASKAMESSVNQHLASIAS